MDSTCASHNPLLTHRSTQRLTPTILQHTFHYPSQDQDHVRWRASQYLELQFPADLDLIGGGRALDDERRRVRVTPCNPPHRTTRTRKGGKHEKEKNEDDEVVVVFMTRSGSVTGLIGLPRFRSLAVQVVGVGGGFGLESLSTSSMASSAASSLICVAGGIGICALLSFPLSLPPDRRDTRRALLWSLQTDDFDLVPHLLQQGLLDPSQWTTIRIFVTSGTELPGPKSMASLGQKCDDVTARVRTSGASTTLQFVLGRMAMTDLLSPSTAVDEKLGKRASNEDGVFSHATSPATVFFCGSKALEWQIKMWAMTMTPPWHVETTQMQK